MGNPRRGFPEKQSVDLFFSSPALIVDTGFRSLRTVTRALPLVHAAFYKRRAKTFVILLSQKSFIDKLNRSVAYVQSGLRLYIQFNKISYLSTVPPCCDTVMPVPLLKYAS